MIYATIRSQEDNPQCADTWAAAIKQFLYKVSSLLTVAGSLHLPDCQVVARGVRVIAPG